MADKKSPKSANARKKSASKPATMKAVNAPQGAAKSSAGKPRKGVSKKVLAPVAATKTTASKGKRSASATKPVNLLSGGNPQIAKADGDAPVQIYITAMPGWKGDIGRRLDEL